MYNLLLASYFPVFVVGLTSVIKEGIKEEVSITNSSSVEGALRILDTGKVNMLVIDLHIGQYKDLKVEGMIDFQVLLSRYPSLKIIVIYEKMDRDLFQWMYLKGVRGILRKESSLKDVQICINKVYTNDIYIENELFLDFINASQPQLRNQQFHRGNLLDKKLTNREKTIAKLLMEGKSNTQICELLKLQPSTVSTFKHKVFKKLQIKSILDLGEAQQLAV